MTEPDDLDLELRVRASLDARAGEVDTAVPVATRARAATQRRRRRRVLAATVAAAVVAVVGSLFLVGRDDPTRVVDPSGRLPTQWRTEYWHGISVEVPADWAWGAGPLRQGHTVLRCGGPDAGTPYVGRPVMQSDACDGTPATHPTAPYVWLDAPVRVGTVDLGNGYAQDTVEVDADGTTVTVGSDDQALRERILSSVEKQERCPSRMSLENEEPYASNVGGADLRSFDLCAYTGSKEAGYSLVYARALDAHDYERWVRATADRAKPFPDCTLVSDVVMMTARFADDSVRTWEVLMPCGPMRAGAAELETNIEMVHVWLDKGLRATLQSYIGPLG